MRYFMHTILLFNDLMYTFYIAKIILRTRTTNYSTFKLYCIHSTKIILERRNINCNFYYLLLTCECFFCKLSVEQLWNFFLRILLRQSNCRSFVLNILYYTVYHLKLLCVLHIVWSTISMKQFYCRSLDCYKRLRYYNKYSSRV